MPTISTLRLDRSIKNKTRKRFKPLVVQTPPEEVCRYDQFPVSRQKLLPRRFPVPLRCGFDPVLTKNGSDCAPGHLVSEMRYRTLNSAIAPGTVFLRQANNQSLHFPARAGSSWAAPVMTVVFLYDQPPVPSQQRIGCEGTDFGQKFGSESFRFGS